MSNLIESDRWEDGIYQLETSDPVIGGPDGVDNLQAKQLANRTRFLKRLVEAGQSNLDAHASAADPHPQYATKIDLAQRLAELVDQSPEALNTLKELASALGNDPNFATTVMNEVAKRAALDSPVFTGMPKGPTPPQFDASTRLATMAALQRALGSFQSSVNLPAGITNGAAADIGKYFTQQAAAAATYALPSTEGLPPGAAIAFKVTSNFPLTIPCNGGDLISANGQTTSSLTLGTGDDVILVCPQKGYWFASGSAVVGQSSKFASSLASNGYQKLPSGLIIQWLQISVPGGSIGATYTLPIAFPNSPIAAAGMLGAAGQVGGSGGVATVYGYNYTRSAVTFYTNQSSGTYSGTAIVLGF
ncbi:hypothetical protein [Burkholderia ubonensis]|uniref:gp53-like domain-containing protein n=1 Tax=Burkholderia ubonensis TaxID=101571 RepID=UPI00075A1640|nr:hypothetical protein [Burkholderia ubonensis]KVZ72527.1 hypothetical protein WL22_11570 [Burkholderia ubonensis]KWE24875.1 hypothetical protein WL75_00125 [Burkholderia ubonensis]